MNKNYKYQLCCSVDYITDLHANDGEWHHICCLWDNSNGSMALHMDGEIRRRPGVHRKGYKIPGGGVIVLGQDQDFDGGGFESDQSFAGEMTNVNVWSRALSSQEISRMSQSCVMSQGDVMNWDDVRGHYHGEVKELPLISCP